MYTVQAKQPKGEKKGNKLKLKPYIQCVCVHVLYMHVTVALHYSIVIITK